MGGCVCRTRSAFIDHLEHVAYHRARTSQPGTQTLREPWLVTLSQHTLYHGKNQEVTGLTPAGSLPPRLEHSLSHFLSLPTSPSLPLSLIFFPLSLSLLSSFHLSVLFLPVSIPPSSFSCHSSPQSLFSPLSLLPPFLPFSSSPNSLSVGLLSLPRCLHFPTSVSVLFLSPLNLVFCPSLWLQLSVLLPPYLLPFVTPHPIFNHTQWGSELSLHTPAGQGGASGLGPREGPRVPSSW